MSCLTGSAIAKGKLSDHIDYDAESFYLACLFHDIGCVPENIKKSAMPKQMQIEMKLILPSYRTKMSFEFWGGIQAREVSTRLSVPRNCLLTLLR